MTTTRRSRVRWSLATAALAVVLAASYWFGEGPYAWKYGDRDVPWLHGLYELEWGERMMPLMPACEAPAQDQFMGLATAESFTALAQEMLARADLRIPHEIDCRELPCLMYVPWGEHGVSFHDHLDALRVAIEGLDAAGRLKGGHMIALLVDGYVERLPWLIPRSQDITDYGEGEGSRAPTVAVIAWIPDDADDGLRARLWWRVEQRMLADAGVDPSVGAVMSTQTQSRDILAQEDHPREWPAFVPRISELHFANGAMTTKIAGPDSLLARGCTPSAWGEESREDQERRFEDALDEVLGGERHLADVDCGERPCILYLAVDDPRPVPELLTEALRFQRREALFHHLRVTLPDGQDGSVVALAWLPESPERPPDPTIEELRMRTSLRMQDAGVRRVNSWLEEVDLPPNAFDPEPESSASGVQSLRHSSASPWDRSRRR